jgi:hypothetical protein
MTADQMRALLLKRYHHDLSEAIGGLRVVERPVLTPGRGQVRRSDQVELLTALGAQPVVDCSVSDFPNQSR